MCNWVSLLPIRVKWRRIALSVPGPSAMPFCSSLDMGNAAGSTPHRRASLRSIISSRPPISSTATINPKTKGARNPKWVYRPPPTGGPITYLGVSVSLFIDTQGNLPNRQPGHCKSKLPCKQWAKNVRHIAWLTAGNLFRRSVASKFIGLIPQGKKFDSHSHQGQAGNPDQWGTNALYKSRKTHYPICVSLHQHNLRKSLQNDASDQMDATWVIPLWEYGYRDGCFQSSWVQM